MNVVRHDDVGVELVELLPLLMVNGSDYDIGDVRPAKIQRARASVVEKAVHGYERLAGSGCREKAAIRRKAAVQAPCDEDRLADRVVMRQAASVEGGHEERVGRGRGVVSEKARRPIENRPQITNLPHTAVHEGKR